MIAAPLQAIAVPVCVAHWQKQDPYVVVSLRNHLSRGQTAVLKNGGVNVSFLPQHNPTHVLAYNVLSGGTGSDAAASLLLDVEAWDWDKVGAHDIIGRAVVDLSHVIGNVCSERGRVPCRTDDVLRW